MDTTLRDDLRGRLEELRAAGLYKSEHVIQTPQSAHVRVAGQGEVLNLCANNYLGLADHPEIVAAAHEALERWGYGMASVRFICGTQQVHRELEERLGELPRAARTRSSTARASTPTAASSRPCSAPRTRSSPTSSTTPRSSTASASARPAGCGIANGDMDELEARLTEAADARHRLIATDGVFSMDGYLAKLPEICDLAERHDAIVMVDDSHAVGFMGAGGRGTHELHDVIGRVDILTGTLGKAMGGASGGYVAARSEVVELLRQRSRPYLFSNSLAPPIAAASLRALDLIERSGELRERLFANTAHFRARMTELGFDVLPGSHPIVPVMVGDAAQAARLADALVRRGVYAVSFSYPVVPQGTARIRTQMSAAHSAADIDFAVDQFAAARAELG